MPRPTTLLTVASLALLVAAIGSPPVAAFQPNVYYEISSVATSDPILLNLSIKFHGQLERHGGKPKQSAYSVHGYWTDQNVQGTSQDTVTAHGTLVVDDAVGSHLGLDVMFVRGNLQPGTAPTFLPIQLDCFSEETKQPPSTWTCQAVQSAAGINPGGYFGALTLNRTNSADQPLCSQFVLGPG